jgi:sec-independent protein translocase protein TatC
MADEQNGEERLEESGRTGTPEPYPPQDPRTESASDYSSSSAPYEPPVLTPAVVPTPMPLAQRQPPAPPPPPGDSDDGEEDEEEEGMLRMSFMEHLEELRSRILKALIGVVVAFFLSIYFCKDLWAIVSAPAATALKNLGYAPKLAAIGPMDQFNIIYLKLPLLVSVFLGSPWVLFQVWGFIAPGLYKRERRWAAPFILSTAGLFILGGLFAYYVAFRFGLEFLLGIGRDVNVLPVISIDYYFDLFVNVTLGVGLVFEMPVIIFFLTLLRIASPRFLIRHSRYAILAITVIAAIVTPTPDIFNMMIFATPMVALFFVGVFASYLLVLKREGKKFPWGLIALVALGIILAIAGAVAVLMYRYHYHFITHSPYFSK